ncbi:hypothetical protein A0256_23410 [Mucilaginibacter sp. PAMC 26640]|nr:hypothetical protein A0256_23410 [Mucilaginibacter sp. PAMC 26640]
METEALQNFISRVEKLDNSVAGSLLNLEKTMMDAISKLSDTKNKYLSVHEVTQFTGFGKKWVQDHKQDIGFSTVGGCLRFKREDVESFMSQNYFKSKSKKSA